MLLFLKLHFDRCLGPSQYFCFLFSHILLDVKEANTTISIFQVFQGYISKVHA